MLSYDVVTANDLATFVKEVNSIVALGFKPQGGVAVSDGRYYQAVMQDIRGDEIENKDKTSVLVEELRKPEAEKTN